MSGGGFETLLRKAGEVLPSEESVLFLPFLAGERSPHMRSDLRAAWLNRSLTPSRSYLVRAVKAPPLPWPRATT